jgi:hypothetical protein
MRVAQRTDIGNWDYVESGVPRAWFQNAGMPRGGKKLARTSLLQTSSSASEHVCFSSEAVWRKFALSNRTTPSNILSLQGFKTMAVVERGKSEPCLLTRGR